MNDHHLRSILLNLQYRLSDHDRDRLHFYLKNDVPRPVGDDSTLSGTLKLWQSLFDQEKITENDFTLLIDAFKQIQYLDAVDLLRKHQRRIQLSGCNQSTQSLASIMPSMMLQEVFNDFEDDQDPSERFSLNQINYNNYQNNNNHLIDSNNISINTNNGNGETESLLLSKKQGFWTVSFTKNCFLLLLISFLLTLVTLIVVVIQAMKHVHSLEANLQMKQNLNTKTKDENNQSVRQLTNLLLEKNVTIEHLNKTLGELNYTNLQTGRILTNKNGLLEECNKTLTEFSQQQNETRKHYTNLILEKNMTIEKLNETISESKKERKTLLIKAGHKFGGDGGEDFDDSLSPMLTTAHYLSGILYSSLNELIAFQFIYTSSHDNQSRIESGIHGNSGHKFNSTYQYYLDDDERIDEVFVRSYDITFTVPNNPSYTTKVVRELQFVTTKGQIIPPVDHYAVDSAAISESFPGYILGYVTGKSGLVIDQLQFFWYRTKK